MKLWTAEKITEKHSELCEMSRFEQFVSVAELRTEIMKHANCTEMHHIGAESATCLDKMLETLDGGKTE